MNILVIDDQTSVLYGIEKNINFKELGFNQAFYASSAAQAREIIINESIQIMLCDIEMPGEDGLSLNEWTLREYPTIVRILLTSHAEFSYARQSIRLECFDYIVQPAPYDEIAGVLRKAIEKYISEEYKRERYKQGEFYDTNQKELLEKTIINFFSTNEYDFNNSLATLSNMGYGISETSVVQMLLIDIFSYAQRTDPNYSDFSNRQIFINALDVVGIVPPIYYFFCKNRFHQYIILLVSAADSLMELSKDVYSRLYGEIVNRLHLDVGMYIGTYTVFKGLRKEARDINKIFNDNISHKAGIFYTSDIELSNRTLNSKENIHRWKLLLEGGQFRKLEENIISYLDFLIGVNQLSYADLCDLHQQLVQMFLSYSYENKIDIINLFGEQYSYNEFMDGFADSNALKKAVRYMIEALSSVEQSEESDVEKAKQFILDNLSKNLTVKSVADYVHRSPEYFTKVFKTETGINIKNYILQIKIDVAKDLLATPNIPISMIATEIGYDNFSHFTQIFKKYEDITPTDYRKKVLGTDEEDY